MRHDTDEVLRRWLRLADCKRQKRISIAGRWPDTRLGRVQEVRLVGGECPYWARTSKMMTRAGNLLAEESRIEGMAGTSVVRADWAPVASGGSARKQDSACGRGRQAACPGRLAGRVIRSC